MYKAVTHGISVTVTPRYVAEESSPSDNRYFFAYAVEIITLSIERVQLRSRYWKIIDGRGNVQEVRESFSYTSGCPLSTPDGTMQGRYGMVTAAGDPFDVEIPAFSLDSPHARRVVH